MDKERKRRKKRNEKEIKEKMKQNERIKQELPMMSYDNSLHAIINAVSPSSRRMLTSTPYV